MINLTQKALRLAICAILVMLISTMLVACSYPKEEQYQNFLLDMDMLTRFDLCIDKVQRNVDQFANQYTDQYTVDELKALQKDLDFWQGDFAEAEDANENLRQCAVLLLDSIEEIKIKNADGATEKLDEALKFYQEAKAFMRKNVGNINV